LHYQESKLGEAVACQRRERERIASLKGRRGAAGQREVEEMESEPRLGILSACRIFLQGSGPG